MKLKITNIGDYPIERLGFTFEPEAVQEVEVETDMEYLVLRAPKNLNAEVIEEPKEEQKEEPKKVKKTKAEGE